MVAAPSGYVCITDQAQGFLYNGQTHRWEGARFKPEGTYVVRKLSDEERQQLGLDRLPRIKDNDWAVFEHDKSDPISSCREISMESLGLTGQPQLSCESVSDPGLHFSISPILLRFQVSKDGNYLIPDSIDKLDAGTPIMEIGRCSPL